MGQTLTWVRRAGALRTDPLEGPFTFMPALQPGEEYFSIPVGTFRSMPDEYTVIGYVPPSYTMPVYRGAEYTDSPPAFPEDPPFRMAPRGGSQQYEERPRKIGKSSEGVARSEKWIAEQRADILKRARGNGKDQRMKDWKAKANAMLKDIGWDPVTEEETSREAKRKRNARSHARKKDRDGDGVRVQIHSPGATAGLAPGAERSVQIVGGVRSDLGLSPLQEAVLDHAQRISGRNMRRSI